MRGCEPPGADNHLHRDGMARILRGTIIVVVGKHGREANALSGSLEQRLG